MIIVWIIVIGIPLSILIWGIAAVIDHNLPSDFDS